MLVMFHQSFSLAVSLHFLYRLLCLLWNISSRTLSLSYSSIRTLTLMSASISLLSRSIFICFTWLRWSSSSSSHCCTFLFNLRTSSSSSLFLTISLLTATACFSSDLLLLSSCSSLLLISFCSSCSLSTSTASKYSGLGADGSILSAKLLWLCLEQSVGQSILKV